jgi:hypothetical protein
VRGCGRVRGGAAVGRAPGALGRGRGHGLLGAGSWSHYLSAACGRGPRHRGSGGGRVGDQPVCGPAEI